MSAIKGSAAVEITRSMVEPIELVSSGIKCGCHPTNLGFCIQVCYGDTLLNELKGSGQANKASADYRYLGFVR